jgi:hypothetical protein
MKISKIDLLGYEVKGIKRTIGHEGESLATGNLYHNGKKIGTGRELDWGGGVDIDFDKSKITDETIPELACINKSLEIDNYDFDLGENSLASIAFNSN